MKDEEETVDVTILAERRAKLAKLRGEHFVHDRDFTSAPSVTVVDEFEYKFGAAKSEKIDDSLDITAGTAHKIFYAESKDRKAERKPSNLEFNSLVNEANQRGRQSSALTSPVNPITEYRRQPSTVFNENSLEKDPKNSSISYSNEYIDDKSNQNDTVKNNRKEGRIVRAYSFSGNNVCRNKSKSKNSKRNSLDDEKSERILQRKLHVTNSIEDLGYISSSSSPHESKKLAGIKNTQNNMETKIESLEDDDLEVFLTKSLPEISLKNNLSICPEGAKFPHNSKQFSTEQNTVGSAGVADPEEDYFQTMKTFHDCYNIQEHTPRLYTSDRTQVINTGNLSSWLLKLWFKLLRNSQYPFRGCLAMTQVDCYFHLF